MLSGIGPKQDLERFEIPVIAELPVGENLHDHMCVSQWWRLRHPERGLAMGSPLLTDPLLLKGNPVDWSVVQTVPAKGLEAAKAADRANNQAIAESLDEGRCFTESLLVYAAANPDNPTIPLDGTHVTSTVAIMLPSSRGSVTLKSKDPTEHPAIDHNYYATETDRYVLRTGLRKMAEIIQRTPEGRDMIEQETVGEDEPKITPESPDADLDLLVQRRSR